jgi:Derlin-2/3
MKLSKADYPASDPCFQLLLFTIRSVQYGAAYEAAKFGSNIADAITMLGVGMGSIMALDLVLPSIFGAAIHGPSLIFMLIYLWSKQNPNSMVSFFGLIQFQAVYLPFGLLAIEFVQGASPVTGILGILAGHVYYFLTDVYPRAYGRTLIQTPTWL